MVLCHNLKKLKFDPGHLQGAKRYQKNHLNESYSLLAMILSLKKFKGSKKIFSDINRVRSGSLRMTIPKGGLKTDPCVLP